MKRVLQIEHRPDVTHWISEVLEEQGFQVSTAENGGCGIQQLTAADFDLIMLSLEVPVKPADRVIEWIMVNRPHLHARILAIADLALTPGIVALLESLEIPLLFMPFTSGELVQQVKAMLRQPTNGSRRGLLRRHALAS